jgi:hypothetical protein
VCSLVFQNTGRWTKSKNPVILIDLEYLDFMWLKSLRPDGMCGQIANISLTHLFQHFSYMNAILLALFYKFIVNITASREETHTCIQVDKAGRFCN